MKILLQLVTIGCLVMLIFSVRENTGFVKMAACNMPTKTYLFHHYLLDRNFNCQEHFRELDMKFELSPKEKTKKKHK